MQEAILKILGSKPPSWKYLYYKHELGAPEVLLVIAKLTSLVSRLQLRQSRVEFGLDVSHSGLLEISHVRQSCTLVGH